jgi:deoxyribonucleoside regulator
MKKNLSKRFDETSADSEYTVISQVAHMYYNLNMLQPEIADKLYFSRSKVSRLLKRARELGIVEIKVRSIPGRTPPLERRLLETFPLKDAIVVESFMEGGGEGALDTVVDFAAIYVSELLRDHTTVGITRGRTVDQVVAKLRKLHECNLQVVQLMGSSTNTFLSAESRELVRRMISTFSANAHFLNTPLYVDDIYAKKILLDDPAIQGVFQMMKQCSMILTGIGNLELQPNAQLGWYGYQNKRHLTELSQKGAVGSICAQYFDRQGRYIPCEWNDKCMAMPYEDILHNDMTVIVAQGQQKIEPVLGALRGKLINVLITDAPTAAGILKENRK